MLELLISVIAPHHCLGCGREGPLLCALCRCNTPSLPYRCYRCRVLSPDSRTCKACRRQSQLHTLQVATEYSGVSKDLVWRLKFSHARAAIKPMGALMAERLVFAGDVTLVPVPTATGRVRQRGYDQAALLTRELARLTGLPFSRPLARHGQVRQVGAGRSERLRHLEGAFELRPGADVQGRHILLVDDVVTTGATLEAAARELRQAGAARIDALVFAQP